jgi:cystathionine beta-lyase family protein involved in aluminum resistance
LQHFGGCTGYEHDDGGGSEAIDSVFGVIFGAETAMVRSQVCTLFDKILNL